MNERERLIEIMEQATNGSCHVEDVADYLLENGVVVPPCKVGDNVFYLHEICDENGDEHIDISTGKCEGISIQKDGLWIYCRYEDGLSYWHKNDKTVFATKEEAQKALRKEDEGK